MQRTEVDRDQTDPASNGRRDAAAIGHLIRPSLEAMGYDLVRLILSGRHAPTLQVMAERHDGRPMSVEACAEISRALSALLDVEDPIAGSYTLEVSSPGLDRPLVKAADFDRFKGRTARIETRFPSDGRRRFQGRLDGVGDGGVRLDTAEGPITIAIEDIARAKLVVDDAFLRDSLRRDASEAQPKARAGIHPRDKRRG